MPNITDLLDGRDLSFAGMPPIAAKPTPGKLAKPAKSSSKTKSASPLATHIATHVQDPMGATKEQFGKLQEAKLNYDMAREETQRNLAPVQSVITHLSQMHGLQPDMPTPAMGQGADPFNPNGGEVDEDGNPIDPNADPNADPNNPMNRVTKNPAMQPMPPKNMDQTVGKMNQNRPSLTEHQPGVAPMMEKQVVPPKLGMASPGKPQARNSPAPNSQGLQYNQQAKPPKGNRSLPGAKGPGDAKVQNRSKKAFGKSTGTKQEQSRPIKVTVHAASVSMPRITTIEELLGIASLKFRCREIKANAGSMPLAPGGALGPSGVMPLAVPKTGQPIQAGGPGSGRHPYSVYVQYKGAVNNAGHQGYIYKNKDFDVRVVKELENKLAKIGERFNGKHIGGPAGHIFRNTVYHHFVFDNEQDARGAHAKFKSAGFKHGLELQHRNKVIDSATIKAGGPGSGRRPGFGTKAKYLPDGRLSSDNRPMHMPSHNALTNAGYKFKGTTYDGEGRSEGYSSYVHPKHGEMDVYQGGQFSGDKGEGYDYGELKEHLQSLGALKASTIQALDELSDKVTDDPGHDVAFNPRTNLTQVKSQGHSHGAKKGWSTRGKGHLSKTEKKAHYSTIDACEKCGKLHARGMACAMRATA